MDFDPHPFKQRIKLIQSRLFTIEEFLSNPFGFSVNYSIEIEKILTDLAGGVKKAGFSIVSCGSFSRRELSPFSDIDVMFIISGEEDFSNEIQTIITNAWDAGIEISHTIREIKDIEAFFVDDLHTFTQFFETRFITGDKSLYENWESSLFAFLLKCSDAAVIEDFIEDAELRYSKYGSSSKVIEPNVKLSAGGLRDFQLLEWLYIVKEKKSINKEISSTQAEIFIDILKQNNYTSAKECQRLIEGYAFILSVRHLLHFYHKEKSDRLEFDDQIKIAKLFLYKKEGYRKLMKRYFESSNVISRYSKSFIKKIKSSYINELPDIISIELDDEFYIKGTTIYSRTSGTLALPVILQGFYYRGLYSGHFDEKLRQQIIDSLDEIDINEDRLSQSRFREILRLPRNVGTTLSVMNELGVLGFLMPEFGEMIGFIQHGVYHSYTADEHTLLAIKNVEALAEDNSEMGRIYNTIPHKELLILAILFHDIAKPINIAGHEIIGAEIAISVMTQIGYEDKEIEMVEFLVRNHLLMEQVAFRRNLNDPETLQNFVSKLTSKESLNLLYLITYADLSAVNPVLWTTWKSDLLRDLFQKSLRLLNDNISAEELLFNSSNPTVSDLLKSNIFLSEENLKEHLDSITDNNYFAQFTTDEIVLHIEEINSGAPVSVLFNEYDNFTNITVITLDTPFLLSKLCGVLSINDLNIHDAKIFTRKDGIVIDNFNVTDFRTHKKIDPQRYSQILDSFKMVISGMVQINSEIKRMKSKWWRIESKFFKRPGNVAIKFEETERFTILDIFSPDRLGFLYQVTRKMNELGLNIYFAKIATKGDEIVDSFYVLDRDKKKVSQNYYNFIEVEIIEAIRQIL